MIISVVLLVLLFCVPIKAENNSQNLIIFHAGSLSVPLKQISDAFMKEHPSVTIVREAGGSRECARKISELKKPCDIIASADYSVIKTLLIPAHAQWNIKFAGNEMALVYTKESRRSQEITDKNWYEILQDKKVLFGRADPNADPCGYRAVLTLKLAEKYYHQPGLAEKLLAKNKEFIRPKETDFLALLETHAIDYVFLYRSVALQHKLPFVSFPDEINLRNPTLSDLYKSVSVELTGKKPGTTITQPGEPMVYAVSIPTASPQKELAQIFLEFMLSKEKGLAIMESCGQPALVPLEEETFNTIPASLQKFALPCNPANSEK